MRKILALASVNAIAAAFMADTLEVVIVHMGGQDVRMNKSDFDAMDEADRPPLASKAKQADAPASVPAGTTINAGPQPPAPSAPTFATPDAQSSDGNTAAGGPVAPTVPSPNQLAVVKDGRKWFVIETAAQTEGQPTVPYQPKEGEAIDPDGYKTEADAWQAIMARPR